MVFLLPHQAMANRNRELPITTGRSGASRGACQDVESLQNFGLHASKINLPLAGRFEQFIWPFPRTHIHGWVVKTPVNTPYITGECRTVIIPVVMVAMVLYMRLTIYMVYRILSVMTIDANSFFSALANDIRLRCLMLLQLEGELCVCELTHALDLSQPMMSRHLALLRNDGLVSDRRAGQWVYYRINPELGEWALHILQTTVEANRHVSPFADDLNALQAMPDRPGAACCA
jgi:ArsR family transcriptional regulator